MSAPGAVKAGSTCPASITSNTGQGRGLRWQNSRKSKARSLGGKDYKIGFLIRSTTALGESKVPSITENFMESEVEKVPWWEFHGTRAVD